MNIGEDWEGFAPVHWKQLLYVSCCGVGGCGGFVGVLLYTFGIRG